MGYSVGVPVRNEENTLKTCLESILNQRISPNKVLVCVNGSTDGTLDIALNLADKYKKIKVLESEPGKPNAWNKIVENSKDNYLMFTDGDVIVDTCAAENLFKTFKENPNLIIVGGTYQYTKPEKKSFVDIFCDDFEKSLNINSLIGRLYLMKKKELFKLANLENVPIIPSEIINEDEFLYNLVKKYDAFENNNEAFITCNSIQSFEDWSKTQFRTLRGSKQIENLYSQLTNKKHLERASYLIKRFNEVESIPKKFGLVLNWFLRQCIKFYIKKENNSTYSNLWKSPKTTKISF